MSNIIDTVNMGYFIYDDVDTRDYDVQVYFKSVDSTPKRVGSFVSIPNRNGAFFVDEGRYEDMPHSYDIIALDPEEGKNIINAIARKTGHHRLEDSFNQDEFYQAIFVSAVEVRTETDRQYLKYALTFTRKPQRFLKSGETPVSVTSGDTLTNPTLFDAKPLIKFNSSGADGSISIGDRNIGVLSAALGIANLDLSVQKAQTSNPLDYVVIRNTSIYNAGDPITIKGGTALFTLVNRVTSFASLNANGLSVDRRGLNLTFTASDTTFTAGTPQTITKTIDVRLTISGTPYFDETKTFTLSIEYDGANQIAYRWTPGDYSFETYAWKESLGVYSGTVNSSKNTLEDVDIYIDLDIGEAYSIDSNDNAVSLNNFINLGSELPVLPLGNTTITYSNTISNFKVTPRWWKV